MKFTYYIFIILICINCIELIRFKYNLNKNEFSLKKIVSLSICNFQKSICISSNIEDGADKDFILDDLNGKEFSIIDEVFSSSCFNYIKDDVKAELISNKEENRTFEIRISHQPKAYKHSFKN